MNSIAAGQSDVNDSLAKQLKRFRSNRFTVASQWQWPGRKPAGLQSVESGAISPEVELGLDMVGFVDIGAADAECCQAQRASGNVAQPRDEQRPTVLTQASFSADSGERQLEQVCRGR